MDGGLGAPAHPTTMLEDPRHAQLLALRQNLAQLQTLGAARTDIEPVAEKIVQLETALIPTLTPEEQANRMFDEGARGRDTSSLHYVGKGLGLAGKKLRLTGGRAAPPAPSAHAGGTAPQLQPRSEWGDPPPPPAPARMSDSDEEPPPPPPPPPPAAAYEDDLPPPPPSPPPRDDGTEFSLSAAEARGLAFQIVNNPSNSLGSTMAVVAWSDGNRVPVNRVVMTVNGADVAGQTVAQLTDAVSSAPPPVSVRVTNSTITDLRQYVVAAYYAQTNGVDLRVQKTSSLDPPVRAQPNGSPA
jgi:hypothetical protein